MEHLPIFINLKQKPVLVVGGGDIALRKINLLIKAQARVDCLSPFFCEGMNSLSRDNYVNLINKSFEPADIKDYSVIIAATDDATVNSSISSIAHDKRIPVNVVDSPALSSFIMPSIVDRSPVIIAVSSAGKAPVLARIIRAKLETVIPSAYGILAEIAGEYRQKVKDRFSKIKDRRAFWEATFSGVIAEKVFSGRINEAKDDIEKQLNDSVEMELGEVYLVGAGPGDPDLLTFKALRLIQQADVVLYDRLVSKGVMDLVRRDSELIYVGKKGGSDKSTRQVDINNQLVELAKSGKRVCRLKGGDPFIFGRGGEEIESLSENGIPFQVVPGITAASGCSSYAGIPLTHRDYSQSCRFVTAHLKNGTTNLPWDEFIVDQQTIVFYMALSGANYICEKLMEHGMDKDMPIAIIEKGTMPEQKVYISSLTKLPDLLAKEDIHAPTLMIVGEVVKLNEKLNWYGN
ncbi:MAG: uroporphyrinogen-III C-methyltransferase [Thiotrichales bacterium]|jgi:uroporphyrin-III C-methyltransferase/precorrin-2 dehydrogenase/sirohydrochlorin ferrochelatase|nr:uroporphyrinogen-III C-methyltransferase [Thiotrichales bacterium]MBT3854938.1 uroporphyrinogen-III C-methyltransferase [Thiotrichales bacterium]MBT4653694.1 uroporphyrinogen-III C-methyltransferase [Thiotrichales bacterium]MBT5500264.1 uroporphyrinogen-III C-methyltransferase [Thiotrichales bacterium]MBT6770860.1 uroporphyrinogen-III C-methyltransferase [Thiotrichales bacterium]